LNFIKVWLWRNINWRLADERCSHDTYFRGWCKTVFVTTPRINGRPLNRLAIQALAMAPRGSTIVVKQTQTDVSIEVTHPDFIKPGDTNVFLLKRDPRTNELYLYIDLVSFATGGPKGFGAVAFLRCAQMCRILGFSRIDLLAAGGQSYKIAPATWNTGFNGYYTWGVFGFNAPLHTVTAKNLRSNPQLNRCGDLLDIIEKNASWWKAQGAGGEMTFDLQDNSRSWHTLLKYLSANGYRK
jgi:hypothetical protein